MRKTAPLAPITTEMSAASKPDPEIYYEWSRPELRALVPAAARRLNDVTAADLDALEHLPAQWRPSTP